MKLKNMFLAAFSSILILFGLLGAAASFTAIPSVKKIREFVKNLPEISQSVKEGFDAMSLALDDASAAALGAGDSVLIIKDILGNVSDFSVQTSKTFYDIAGFMNFEILGQKPFGDSYIHYIKIGDTLIELSENVSGTSDSILKNIDDVEKLGRDLKDISSKIGVVSSQVYSLGETLQYDSIARTLYFLIGYIILLNIMFVLIGVSILLLIKH